MLLVSRQILTQSLDCAGPTSHKCADTHAKEKQSRLQLSSRDGVRRRHIMLATVTETNRIA